MADETSAEKQARVSQPLHLGDGVYASFDGYHIWLAANDPDSPQKVALEPAVLGQVMGYARQINEAYETQVFPI